MARFSSKHVGFVCCASAAVCLGYGRPVSAQTASGQAAPEAGLEEIVVTAQKRSENIQDVPISISAIDATALAQRGITSSMDLQFVTPGLVYTALVGNAQPYLRGIGSDLAIPNADAVVATYEDGVYVSAGQGTIINLLGVDRVEVLAGPQGTLYGRNAVGGAISIYTLTPGRDFETAGSVGYGNFDQVELTGRMSGPVTDTLSLGIYAAGTRDHGYIRFNPVPGEPGYNDAGAVRLKAVWTPTGDFTLTGSLERVRSTDRDAAAQVQSQPTALGYELGAPNRIQSYYNDNNFAVYNGNSQWNAMLREEQNLGFAKLVGISGYRDLKDFLSVDIDGTTADLLQSTEQTSVSQLSQEIQLISDAGSRVSWITGLYYFHETASESPDKIFSAVIAPPDVVPATFGETRTNSYAAFGQFTVPLIASLRLTGGLRYTVDDKAFNGATGVYDTAGDLTAYLPVTPNSHRWNKLTPKVTFDGKIGDVLLYATYSEGYKSGVYNLLSPTSASLGPVNPQTLHDYEAGFKSELYDRRVRLNGDLYYYKEADLQVQTTSPTSAGIVDLRNAASARVYGAESTLDVALTRAFSLNVGANYNDARFIRFPGAQGIAPAPAGFTQISIDASGNRIPRTPNWSGFVGGAYDYRLGTGARINVSANAYLSSGFFWDSGNQLYQSSYEVLNSVVAYTFPGDRFTVSVWGKNLTDKYYLTGRTATFVGDGLTPAAPRTYGIKFSYVR